MHITKLLILTLIVMLQVLTFIQPAGSAGTTHSAAIAVDSIVSLAGGTEGSIAAMASLDQSSIQDEPAKYVRFLATDIAYHGDLTFRLPNDTQTGSITTALLQLNFNAPANDGLVWTWSILDQTSGQWHKLADSIGAQPGQWNKLLFRIQSITPYVSANRTVKIRMTSNEMNTFAKLDYAALHITYIPGSPTATQPIPTAMVTRGRYVFPITFTPTLTYTPTNTFTPTNTATATNTPTSTRTPSPTATLDCAGHDNLFECQVLHLINQERAKVGSPALNSNILLHGAARGHSTDMAQQDFFAHDSLDGTKFYERIAATGYPAGGCGENIAAGHSTPEAVMAGWMASEGHRNNILFSGYVDIGIGYYYLSPDPGSYTYRHYWTTDFC